MSKTIGWMALLGGLATAVGCGPGSDAVDPKPNDDDDDTPTTTTTGGGGEGQGGAGQGGAAGGEGGAMRMVGSGGEVHGGAGPGGGGPSSGTGGSMMGDCLLGEVEVCYSGPPGTQGVGLCVAGTQACQSDLTWGPCQGEVLPAAETCAT